MAPMVTSEVVFVRGVSVDVPRAPRETSNLIRPFYDSYSAKNCILIFYRELNPEILHGIIS